MSLPARITSLSNGWRWLGTLAALGGVCLLAATSCRRSPTDVRNGATQQEECGTILDSANDMAQPLKLGVTSSIESVVNRLNDSRRTCPVPKGWTPTLPAETKSVLATVFSKKQLDVIQGDVYQDLDARHVRNSLVLARIAGAVTAGGQSDLDQVVDAFYYVVRNVDLEVRKPEEAPRPIFRTLLFGRGTAADRAWVFAAILRQLKLSAVVLTPAKPAGKPPHLLVGVLLNGSIRLFDPQLGLPVPAPDDDRTQPVIRRPATLAEFVKDPKIAQSLSAGGFKYPLTADDLKHPKVGLIGHRSVWSPRMMRLYRTGRIRYETAAGTKTSGQKAELYEELGGPQGAISRTVEFSDGLIARKDIAVWPYPQQQFDAFANMNAAQRTEMSRMVRPFDVPRAVTIDKKTRKPQFGQQSRLQLTARILQLLGDYDKAVKSFVSVSSQARSMLKDYPELPITEQEMLAQADQDAGFWIGLAKFELGDVTTAAARFTAFKASPKWGHQAGYLLAIIAANENKPALARTELDAVIQRKPTQAHGCAVLWQRWKSLGESEKKPPAGKAAAKPEKSEPPQSKKTSP